MTNYISSFEKHGQKKTCRYGYVVLNELWPKLKEVVAQYDNQSVSEKEGFYPPNEFEDMFMRFILINKISDSFRLCIEKMPKYGTYEEFKKKISLNLSLESDELFENIDKENGDAQMSPNKVSPQICAFFLRIYMPKYILKPSISGYIGKYCIFVDGRSFR